MTRLDFATVLDSAPADDTGERFRVVWTVLGSSSYAHAYPAEHVDRRHHLCQGRYLSKLRDPSTSPGKHELPLYSPARIKAFLAHQRRADPVCACCYGVLYWLVGDLATQTVHGYRLRLFAARKE